MMIDSITKHLKSQSKLSLYYNRSFIFQSTLFYWNFGVISSAIIIKMDDDIFFIPDTISIMSKLKEAAQEHSLSKIIREQALHYDEENIHEYSKYKDDKINQYQPTRTGRTDPASAECTSNPQLQPATLQQCNHRKQARAEQHHQKVEKRRRDGTAETATLGSADKKNNLLVFEEEDREPKIGSNSKKQKREGKLRLDQQKTKKIQFQDIDRYKKEGKKEEPTKIRHNEDEYQPTDEALGLSSKQNSNLMDSRDLGILTHQVLSNYGVLSAQVKEQMAFIRCQHIEAQKIQIRKNISKLEGEIRRIKIGFRGSDSLSKGSPSAFTPSKIKYQESRLKTEEAEGSGVKVKRKGEMITTNKIESRLRKEKSPQNYLRFVNDYGVEPQNPSQENPKVKLERLEEEVRCQLTKQNKFTSRLNDLQKKYNILRTNNLRKDESLLRREANNGGSIIKRSNLLRERIAFLKNELKQTKAFYSNKIKRLRNENTILNNENIYITKEIQESKQQLKQNKLPNTDQAIPNKQNLMIFDEEEPKSTNYRVYDGPSKVASTSNKDLTSGIASINDIRSLQSINSVKSINFFHSKPSLGSINSYKSTKIESLEKKPLESHNPIKNKLKIKSPHHLSPPSLGELKQNSFLKRFNPEQSRHTNLSKKSTSLDVAIRELQQKYSKHMQERYNEDEYYK